MFTICAVLIIVIGLNRLYLKTNKEDFSLREAPVQEEEVTIPEVPVPAQEIPQEQEKPILPPEVEEPEPVSPPPPRAENTEGRFAIQVASFQDKDKANLIVDKLTQEGYSAYIITKHLGGKGRWYRVLIGDFTTKEEVVALLEKIQEKYKDSFIKPL